MTMPDVSGLPENLDLTYADDAANPGRKAHQQHHDTVHAFAKAAGSTFQTKVMGVDAQGVPYYDLDGVVAGETAALTLVDGEPTLVTNSDSVPLLTQATADGTYAASFVVDAALGDGATPASAAIQAKIDAAAAAGGGEVVLPPGQYVLDATLVMKSLVHLRGRGRTTLRFHGSDLSRDLHAVTLLLGAGVNADAVQFAQDCANASVSGLLIDANKTQQTAGHGLRFVGPAVESRWRNTLLDVHVRNAKQDGVHIEGTQAEPVLLDVMSTFNDGHGIVVRSEDAVLSTIGVGANGGSGLVIGEVTGGTTRVRDLDTFENTGHGCEIHDLFGVRLFNFQSNGNQKSGLYIYGNPLPGFQVNYVEVLGGLIKNNSRAGSGLWPDVLLTDADFGPRMIRFVGVTIGQDSATFASYAVSDTSVTAYPIVFEGCTLDRRAFVTAVFNRTNFHHEWGNQDWDGPRANHTGAATRISGAVTIPNSTHNAPIWIDATDFQPSLLTADVGGATGSGAIKGRLFDGTNIERISKALHIPWPTVKVTIRTASTVATAGDYRFRAYGAAMAAGSSANAGLPTQIGGAATITNAGQWIVTDTVMSASYTGFTAGALNKILLDREATNAADTLDGVDVLLLGVLIEKV